MGGLVGWEEAWNRLCKNDTSNCTRVERVTRYLGYLTYPYLPIL